MQDAEKLIEEIRQITTQYRAEVGSRRKPWPKSIITRVNELGELGLNSKAISDRTGIPYFSILNWRQGKRRKAKAFHALVVRPPELETATVTVPVGSGHQIATVTVTTPDGYRVQVESVIVAVELLSRLRGA
jgi:hypothetical protein